MLEHRYVEAELVLTKRGREKHGGEVGHMDCGGGHFGSGGKRPMPAKSNHYLYETMAQEVWDDAVELVRTLVGHWRERGGSGGAPSR
jgi:hypothetical protein